MSHDCLRTEDAKTKVFAERQANEKQVNSHLQNSETSAKNTQTVRNVYILLDLRSALSQTSQPGRKQDYFGELK